MSAAEAVIDDETRAYRIIDDRRCKRFTVHGEGGWLEIEVAASALEPGFLVIRTGSSDPVLLHEGQVHALLQLVADVNAKSVQFPLVPRPCEECDERLHDVDDCEQAEWDPTVIDDAVLAAVEALS